MSTTTARKTTRRNKETGCVTDTYRIVRDESGVSPPPFANTRNPETAGYSLHWGWPVPWAGPVAHATCNGVATGPTWAADEKARLEAAFGAAVEAAFAGHGFSRHPSGAEWVHADHGRTSFARLSVSSDGELWAEAACGMQVIRYEITDHATAQRLLDAATGESGMV